MELEGHQAEETAEMQNESAKMLNYPRSGTTKTYPFVILLKMCFYLKSKSADFKIGGRYT